jgi:hypothetical protein
VLTNGELLRTDQLTTTKALADSVSKMDELIDTVETVEIVDGVRDD